MSNNDSIWKLVADAVQLYFYPLRQAYQNRPTGIARFIENAVISSDASKTEAIEELTASVAAFIGDLSDVKNPADAIRSIDGLLSALNHATQSLAAEAEILLEYLSIQFLWNANPKVYSILALIGVIDESKSPLSRLTWGNLKYLGRPRELMREIYRWGSEDFDGDRLLEQFANAAAAFGAPVSYNAVAEAKRSIIDPHHTADWQGHLALAAPLLHKIVGPAHVSAGFTAVPISGGEDPANAGIVIVPFINADFPEELAPGWKVNIANRGTEGRGVAIRPLGVEAVVLEGPADSPGRITITISRDAGNPWQQNFGGIFDISAAAIKLSVDADLGTSLRFGAQICVDDFEIRLTPDNLDGFLSKLLPPEGIAVSSAFTLTWSPDEGLTFSASGGLAISIPLHCSLGPLKLDTLHLSGYFEGAIITVDGLLDLGGDIGPIKAAVGNFGVRVQFTLDKESARDRGFDQIGPFGVAIGVVPPTKVGLAIDAGGIIGGGFLDFNKKEERYAGILQLNFGDIGLVAIGLITTKMPDGSKGFSMLIVISVEFSPAIQLSFGFTLSGVGGLLGVHRTVLVDVLRDGLKRHTLDSILFPQDPILNAPKITSDLGSVFPPKEGRFAFGPMAKINWGSPNILTADIGIIIELPDPIRVIILGQIEAKFPKPEDAIVVLHLDILGVIEFAKKTLAIDLTIYDSKILTYELSGDGAFRLSFGDNPAFAMSLGGLHPRFSPPPAFPILRRLKLDLSSSSSFELSCEVYQALTSNSLQFGARLVLYAEAAGASLDGELSFDTLIYFSPFSFEVDISGKVVARYKGQKLASVSLSLTLSGPTPWRAKGKASFEILCWDVDISFNKSWGRDNPARLDAVDPWVPLLEALRRPETYSGALPAGMSMGEQLRSLAEESNIVFAHPAGTLEIRQKVLPFDLKLERFGNAPVKDHDTFQIVKLEAGQGNDFTVLDTEDLKDYFARGQYEELSKDEKLSLPSFEKLKAGVVARPIVRLDGVVQEFKIVYESIVIDSDGTATSPTVTLADGTIKQLFGDLQWASGMRLVKKAATRCAGIRNSGLARFKTSRANSKVRVEEDEYVIVRATNLIPIGIETIQGNNGSFTRIEADQALAKYLTQHPDQEGEMLVVATFEAAA